MEIWKDIPNYEGLYEASNYGNVRSKDRLVFYKDGRKNIFKGVFIEKINRGKYFYVGLCKNGVSRSISVHNIIAMTFLNYIPNKKLDFIVDHIDNDSHNNRVKNLQIITQRENVSKDKKNKTSKYTGVCWSKAHKKWISHIKINGKSKHLGCFINEYNAHLAYQNALKNLTI